MRTMNATLLAGMATDNVLTVVLAEVWEEVSAGSLSDSLLVVGIAAGIR